MGVCSNIHQEYFGSMDLDVRITISYIYSMYFEKHVGQSTEYYAEPMMHICIGFAECQRDGPKVKAKIGALQ